ncbi:MAG: PIN domain-containing protein [Deltaproteobacteria bacterium]|nr:PIN domain-containing protein [Deltaproteobacteria bacterium]
MRFLVDTNVLLHAVNRDAPSHRRARDALSSWLAGSVPWCLSWNVLYEFLRVATHRRVFPRPLRASAAFDFLSVLLDSDLVTVLVPTERHAPLLKSTIAEVGRPAGNLMHDLHTAVLMREHGVPEIMTADADFLRFGFLTVTDPTRA